MATELVHLIFRNYVALSRTIAAFPADSAVGRRVIHYLRSQGTIVDMTAGRHARAAIVMDSDHLVLTSAHPGVIRKCLAASRCGAGAQEEPPEKVSDAAGGKTVASWTTTRG